MTLCVQVIDRPNDYRLCCHRMTLRILQNYFETFVLQKISSRRRPQSNHNLSTIRPIKFMALSIADEMWLQPKAVRLDLILGCKMCGLMSNYTMRASRQQIFGIGLIAELPFLDLAEWRNNRTKSHRCTCSNKKVTRWQRLKGNLAPCHKIWVHHGPSMQWGFVQIRRSTIYLLFILPCRHRCFQPMSDVVYRSPSWV